MLDGTGRLFAPVRRFESRWGRQAPVSDGTVAESRRRGRPCFRSIPLASPILDAHWRTAVTPGHQLPDRSVTIDPHAYLASRSHAPDKPESGRAPAETPPALTLKPVASACWRGRREHLQRALQ